MEDATIVFQIIALVDLANENMEMGVASLQGRKKNHKTRTESIKRLRNLPTHRRDLNEQLDEKVGVQREILDVDTHTWMVTS